MRKSYLELVETSTGLKLEKDNSGDSYNMKIKNCTVKEIPSFLDYINAGVDMNLMVAIDFTASNGDPRYP